MFHEPGLLLPSVKSFFALVLLLVEDSPPQFLILVNIELLLLFPDSHGPFDLLVCASVHEEPDPLNGIGLEHVPIHLILLVLLPSIEHSGLELVGLNHNGDVLVLLSCAEGLKSVVVPLVECRLHYVLA